MSRIFAIGDIHGCLDELKALLQLIQPKPTDSLVFLGDLINKGPDSLGVIRYVKDLPNARVLFGNHERRLLQYKEFGRTEQLKSFDWNVIDQLTSKDWKFLKTFEHSILFPEEETVCIHGGFLYNLPWDQQSPSITTEVQAINPDSGAWGRRGKIEQGDCWAAFWKGPPYVVYGHTPDRDVVKHPWAICIDTGCAFGGHLTAFEIKSKKIYQVPALRDHTETLNNNNSKAS